jgi:hypothetical protein
MQAYGVFDHSERGRAAVKRGFSWPGFFFTTYWAFAKRLWLQGILLLLVTIPIAVIWWGVFGLGDLQEGYIFRIIISVIFCLIVGVKGNAWRRTNLELGGYRFIGTIRARDVQDALSKVAAAGGTIPAELKAPSASGGFFAVPMTFQPILAVVTLTWKAAFRYRLFWVLAALLLAAVVGLPLLLKDDGTVEGVAQILLTYTLGAVTGILGLCTLWLACGTLARDVEECQIQMVAVKPIARWQIWLGKWLGLVTLDAALLGICGLSIYGLLELRANRLPPAERARLKYEVLVARASVKETGVEDLIDEATDKIFEQRMAKGFPKGVDPRAVKAQMREQVKAEYQLYPPERSGVYHRPWVIHLGSAKDSLKGQPLFLRVKFNSADYNSAGTYYVGWVVGASSSVEPWVSDVMSLAPDTFHEFPIPPNLFDQNGDLTIMCHNLNASALLFPLDDGMEVLYRQGGFGLNFIRGLGIILCWMALFATLGLAAASFMSFPVAAFFSLAVLTMSLSSGTLANVVQEGTIMGYNEEKGTSGHSPIDTVVVPTFRAVLHVIQLVQQFSPIESLSTGRMIAWTDLSLAIAQIVLLLGGILGVFGMFVFNRRELATAQGNN